MRSLRSLVLLAALALTVGVSAQDNLMTAAKARFKPIPTTPPALPGNPATPAKVELGAMLYFDPRLSASHAISCSSCHNIGLGGVDAQETSIGHGWQRGDCGRKEDFLKHRHTPSERGREPLLRAN